MTNIHTAHHNYDANGLSAEIEGYIKQSLQHALVSVGMDNPDIIDLGADYGYANKAYLDLGQKGSFYNVELYSTHNPYGFEFMRENLEDTRLALKIAKTVPDQVDIAFINHVLEHLYNPWGFMQQVAQMAEHVFIAVPDASAEWSRWEGHYSIWTVEWLDHFMALNGYAPMVKTTTRCFRGTNLEVWGVYKKAF